MSQPSPAVSTSVASTSTSHLHQEVATSSSSSTDQKIQHVAAANLCEKCDKPAKQFCSRCRRVVYCTVDCQKAAWSEFHKRICVQVAKQEDYAKRDGDGLTPLHYAVLYGKEAKLADEQRKQLSEEN